jgi:F-box-like
VISATLTTIVLSYDAGRISPRVTICSLPDNVLLDIFEFCQVQRWDGRPGMAWTKLVHVCQRWRYIVFASPLRLYLRLLCTERTPVRKTLDVWPPLPIEIWFFQVRLRVEDNVIAALEGPNRVRSILLNDITIPLEHLVAVMQDPFPELESLALRVEWPCGNVPPLPSTFLGGSAPRLRSLHLDGIPFPTLPQLLLSSNHLVNLRLFRIPHSGYISPEAMAMCISTLTSLTRFSIGFISPTSHPDPRTRRPPPLTRAVLPALTKFYFRGVTEYLEDLVARIDAPLLYSVDIRFFNQLVFGIQQLGRFIGHAPALMSCDMAEIYIYEYCIVMRLMPMRPPPFHILIFKISCREIDWQVLAMAQICNQLSESFISSIEHLFIQDVDATSSTFPSTLEGFMEETQWLELFHPFIAVKSLEMRSETTRMGSHILSALRGLSVELATEILPALDSLNLEDNQESGPEEQDIEPFIVARQGSDHPVAFHRRKKEVVDSIYTSYS